MNGDVKTLLYLLETAEDRRKAKQSDMIIGWAIIFLTFLATLAVIFIATYLAVTVVR